MSAEEKSDDQVPFPAEKPSTSKITGYLLFVFRSSSQTKFKMMTKNLILLLLLCSILEVLGQTAGANYEEQILKARAYVDSLKQAQRIPAVSVAVGVNGRLVWSEAFGYADVKQSIPATTETKFRAGSVAKSWTSFALGKLYDEGMITFDDTLSTYLDEFKDKKYPVTIRQLTGHTGGMRHHKGFEYLSNKQYESVREAMCIQ